MEKKISLQIFLARCGVSSRRGAEAFITGGRVEVNEKPVFKPFFKIDPAKDIVTLDNKKIAPKPKVYLLLNKPEGVTTTRKDPYANKTVLELLPKEYRHLNPVGRLDRSTSGLLLLTNDGELAFRLTHPKFKVEKAYRVVLDRPIVNRDIARLKEGVLLGDGISSCIKARALRPFKVIVTVCEGRKRQIRRMFDTLGYKVIKLARIQEGCLKLADLPPGKFRALSSREIEKLYNTLGLDRDV